MNDGLRSFNKCVEMRKIYFFDIPSEARCPVAEPLKITLKHYG